MNPSALINRREALARLGVLLGGALIGGDAYLRGEPLRDKRSIATFSAAEIALLDEIAETIIPATDTPGAKAAHVGAFMAMMVRDCYDDTHQDAFKAGLSEIDATARARFGGDFMAASTAQRTALLNELDAAQKSPGNPSTTGQPAAYFRMMKQLTVLGYFTSEIGATQALRFAEVPGKFDGNAPYRPGERNWFTPPSRSL